MDKNLPVDIIIVAPTAIAGEHLKTGTVLKKVESELAMELAGAGKARLYSKELEADIKKQVEAEDAAVKNREAQQMLTSAGVNADAIATALGAAIQQGVELALSKVTAPAAAA